MKLTLFCKARESDGRKWTNYTAKRKNEWYSVKFVKGCENPKVYEVDTNIRRAFIRLTSANEFNIADSDFGKVLYVENYEKLTSAEIDAVIENEKAQIKKYRDEREKSKLDFLDTSEDEEELPF